MTITNNKESSSKTSPRKYCIKDAASEVAKNMVPGETLLGYQVVNRMRDYLFRNGYKGWPLETTMLARFREVRDLHDVETAQGVSEYTKRKR